METTDLICLIGFTFLFSTLNLLMFLIRSYIRNKAPGTQSLYDIVTGDSFLFVHFSGSTFTLIAIFSRFDFVVKLASDSKLFVTVVCSLYCLAFISVCVHSGCLCILRIVCLANLSFVEDVIGENRTRVSITGLSIFLAVAACVAQVLSGDINSGTAFAFLTRKAVTTGNSIKPCHNKFFLHFSVSELEKLIYNRTLFVLADPRKKR